MRELKVGDRILLELELKEINLDREYPLEFYRVTADDQLAGYGLCAFTADMKFHTSELPAKYTLIERGFLVGDRVKCPLYGEGTVSVVKNVGTFPVEVDFDNGKDSMYTKDGRWRVDLNPTLERLEEGTTHASVGA